jgi:hypothetical protein
VDSGESEPPGIPHVSGAGDQLPFPRKEATNSPRPDPIFVCQRPKVRGGFGAGKGEMEVGAAPQAHASVHGVFAFGKEVGDVTVVGFVGGEDQGDFLAFDGSGDQGSESAEDLSPDVLEGLPGPFGRRLICS